MEPNDGKTNSIDDVQLSPAKKSKIETESGSVSAAGNFTPVSSGSGAARRTPSSCSPSSLDYERASARRARQEAQEQKRLEEKLKQEEIALKEREAAELRAAKKRKLDEERREAKREKDRLAKLKAKEKEAAKKAASKKKSSSSGTSNSSGGGGGGSNEKNDLKKEMREAIKRFEKDIEKLEKEVVQANKQEQSDVKSLEQLNQNKVFGILQSLENEKRFQKLRSKLFHFAGNTFKPYALTESILPKSTGPSDWGTGELLRIHDTCISFHKVLGLSPFPLKDLGCALRQTSHESILVTTVAMSLLKALLTPVRRGLPTSNQSSAHYRKANNVELLEEPIDIYKADGGDNSSSTRSTSNTLGNMVKSSEVDNVIDAMLPSTPPLDACTSLTWQHILYHVLIRSSVTESFFDTSPLSKQPPTSDKERTILQDHINRGETLKDALKALKNTEFYMLKFEFKLALLGCLSTQALLGGSISEELSERWEQRSDIEKRRREEELEENKKKREERAILKEEAILLLKEERRNADAKQAEIEAAKEAKDNEGKSEEASADNAAAASSSNPSKSSKSQSTMDSFTTKKSKDKSSLASTDSLGKLSKNEEDMEDEEDEGSNPAAASTGSSSKASSNKKAVKSDKEYMPSNVAIALKIKELEEIKAIGDYKVKDIFGSSSNSSSSGKKGSSHHKSSSSSASGGAGGQQLTLDSMFNQDNGLKAAEKELAAAQAELDSYNSAEVEEEAIREMKLSRTQLLQHRKDREDLKAHCKKRLYAAEERLNEIEERNGVILKMDEMIKSFSDGAASSTFTSKQINTFLKQAKEYDELHGEDEEGNLWCIPQIKELSKKVYELKQLEAKTRKDNYWIEQFDQLSVRREPLAMFSANSILENEDETKPEEKQSNSCASSLQDSVILSFWCFGKDVSSANAKSNNAKSKSSKPNSKGKQENLPLLWIKVHSPLNKSENAATAALDGEQRVSSMSNKVEFASRWTCIDNIEQLQAFYNELNNCISKSKNEDDNLKHLKNSLLVHYFDELNAGDEEDEDDVEWRLNHDYVGKRVKRVYNVSKSKTLVNCGNVKGWLPANENEGLALWHVKHDDDDSEDLEEGEVEEGMALWDESDEKVLYEQKQAAQAAEAAEKADTGGGDRNTSVVVDQFDEYNEDAPWRQYVNKALNPRDRLQDEDIGLKSFTDKLYQFEEGCFEFIKEKEKEKEKLDTSYECPWSRGRNNVGVARASWRLSLENAASISEVRELLITFEEFLRTFQVLEDIDDDGLRFNIMAKEGWLFGKNISLDGRADTNSGDGGDSTDTLQQPHEFVGKLVRRFYNGKKSDGKIVAYLPADEEEDAQALWHMVHVDGDEEDLEEDEVRKAIDSFDNNDDVDAALDEEEEEDNLQDSEDEEDGEDDEGGDSDEDGDMSLDEEEEDESKRTLWATLGVRERWRSAVRNANTVGQVALALMFLKEAASKFGMWEELKSKEARGLGLGSKFNNSAGSSNQRKSTGGSLLKQLSSAGGYGGRAAAAAARAKISRSARDEQSIFDDEGSSKKRRKSSGGGGDKRSRTSSPRKNKKGGKRRR